MKVEWGLYMWRRKKVAGDVCRARPKDIRGGISLHCILSFFALHNSSFFALHEFVFLCIAMELRLPLPGGCKVM